MPHDRPVPAAGCARGLGAPESGTQTPEIRRIWPTFLEMFNHVIYIYITYIILYIYYIYYIIPLIYRSMYHYITIFTDAMLYIYTVNIVIPYKVVPQFDSVQLVRL